MKKNLLIILSLITINSFAQQKKRSTLFSITGEGAIMATEQAHTVYNPGFGGSAKLLLPTGKKNNYFTATLGVLNFSGRAGTAKNMFSNIKDFKELLTVFPFLNGPLDSINLSHPPLTTFTPKIGYKYFINKKISTEVEIGYCFASVKKLILAYPGEIGGYDFSIGFGVMVSQKIDIGMRYEQFQSTASQRDFTSYLALRTLVNIDFK